MTITAPRDNGGRFTEYALDEGDAVDLLASPADHALVLHAANSRAEAERNRIPISQQEWSKDTELIVECDGTGTSVAVKHLIPGQQLRVTNGTATYLGVIEDRGDKSLVEIVKDPLECRVCYQLSYSTESDTGTCMSCRGHYGWTNPATSVLGYDD